MKRLGKQLRPTLDTFNFWALIAYIGLAAVVIGLYFVNQNTTRNISRTNADEAGHTAEITSNARSRYQECLASIPELRNIDRFIDGAATVDSALVANSRANLAATPRTSPIYLTRVANLARLRSAEQAAYKVKFPVPTLSECVALRTRLLAQQ